MGFLRTWILGLTGASILAALAQQLTPNGPVKKVTRLVCGILLAGIMLRPILEPDRDVLAGAMARFRATEAELTQGIEEREKQLLRSYIEEQCQAYIWDEAQLLGITDLICSVRVKWRDESWVPYEAELTTAAVEPQRRRLEAWLDGELGIPAERQRWHEP